MTYGLPYMGSKNKIARKIVETLPRAEYFVDLFCGGCAVTHAAILSGKYKKFIINDISDGLPRLFLDAINGKYQNENRWISRDEFFRMKNFDPYVSTCWSFGSGGFSYIYSREQEPFKRALHFARIFGDCSLLEHGFGIKNFTGYRLQSLERLRRIQQLQKLRTHNIDIQISSGDYQNAKIPANSVVYCDPPYNCYSSADKRTYCNGFSKTRFIDWLRVVPFAVYISEYEMPDDFVPIWKTDMVCSFNHNIKTIEKLLIHTRFVKTREK